MIEIWVALIGELIFWWFSKKYGTFFSKDNLALLNIAIVVGFAVIGYWIRSVIKLMNQEVS